jgi:hypothetical protein
MNGYPYSDKDTEKFDMIAVNLIKRICSKEVKIVLSSTWRFDKKYKGILDLPIIDRTPDLPGIRGNEISVWMQKNKTPISHWAIIDDSDDMLESQLPNFVHVDGINGLLWADYEKLCQILDVSI